MKCIFEKFSAFIYASINNRNETPLKDYDLLPLNVVTEFKRDQNSANVR